MPEQNTESEFWPISTSGAARRVRTQAASNGTRRTVNQVSDRMDSSRNGCRPVLSSVMTKRITGAGIKARIGGWMSMTQMTMIPDSSTRTARRSIGQCGRGIFGGA